MDKILECSNTFFGNLCLRKKIENASFQKNLNILITGKLNKAGFRYFIKQRAAKFNITGSVRYKTPDSIIVEACGNSDDLDEFLEYCRLGVPFSKIEKIEVSETPLKDYQTFEVID